ncbi:pilus assembly protein CpaF [Lachnospiraceae bacterium XBB1006]|nr:pilus assembly protein CpaF [Lachnospiraceae bacterium XBB1006]
MQIECLRKGNIMDQERYKKMRRQVLSELEECECLNDEVIKMVIARVVAKEERHFGFSYEEWLEYEVNIFNSLKKFDVIEELMADPEVTEVMINGPFRVFYEKKGRVYPFEKCFESRERLQEIIEQIVGEHNRRVNTKSPIVDSRLADGSRVHIVLEPISLEGPVVTIRKFPPEVMGLSYLVEHDSMPEEVAEYLRNLVKNKKTILVTGGTGSGKTTLLNALSEGIEKSERVITIEDSAELQLRQVENLIRLECRDATENGAGAITIRDLIKAALRMRPDKIVIGEVRGPEALDLLQALNTGHEGSMSSLHANSCKDAILRLETLVLMAMDLPIKAVRAQIASGIQYIVHVKKYGDGVRRLDQIIQIDGLCEEEVAYHPIYQRVEGHLQKVGEDIA